MFFFIYFWGPIFIDLFQCFSAFQTKISDPKLDKIYFRETTIEIVVEFS